MGVTIKEAQLVEELKGSDKLPISDGSNIPKSVSVEQIKMFANKDVKKPTKVSELENDSEFTTKKELEEAINSIPIPDVSGQISEALVDYVKKVEGKGLSTNDFTNELKEKLEGITPYDPSELEAEISKLETSLNTLVSGNASNAIESFNEIIAFLNNVSDKETLSGIIAGINTRIAEVEGKIPTKVSELTNDNGYLTEHQDISHLATKNELKSKQDVISDLANIREGSAKGATAIQEEQYKGTIAAVNTDESVDDPNIPSGSYDDTEIKKQIAGLASEVERKQENLISGQNIKTINGKSLLGEGNIEIERGSSYDDTELKNQITDLETEVSKKADEAETASKLSKLGSEVKEVKEFVGFVGFSGTEEVTELVNHGITSESLEISYNSDGTMQTYKDWVISEPISIPSRIKRIYGTVIGYNALGIVLPGLVYLDNDKNFISAINPTTSGNGSFEKYDIDDNSIPADARYIVLQARGRGTSQNQSGIEVFFTYTKEIGFTNLRERIDNLGNKVLSNTMPLSGMTTLCLGDSITRGDYGSEPGGTANVHDENYPYFMSKKYGCEVVNEGRNGGTAISCWNGVIKNVTLDNIDAVVIMFGANGSITNTLATDVEPYVGYENYALTQCGAMCKIIEYIYEKNPNISIFVCTPPQAGIKRQVYRDRIIASQEGVKSISKRYHIPLIDVYNEAGVSDWTQDVLQPIDNLHFGAVGYSRLGTFIGSKIISNLALDLSKEE